MFDDYAHAASLQSRHTAYADAQEDAAALAHDDMWKEAREYAAVMAIVRLMLPAAEAERIAETLRESDALYSIAESIDSGREDTSLSELVDTLIGTMMSTTRALELVQAAADGEAGK